MRKTYYLSLDCSAEENRILEESLRELSYLLLQPPLKVCHKFEPLPKEQKTNIIKSLSFLDIYEIMDNIGDIFLKYYKRLQNLIILCSDKNNLKKLVLKENPNALWGGNKGWLSIVYHIDKYAIWHEAFHILGAEDCYDDNFKSICQLHNCIMQYAPTRENIEVWPFLCEENIEKIKDRIKKWKNQKNVKVN